MHNLTLKENKGLLHRSFLCYCPSKLLYPIPPYSRTVHGVQIGNTPQYPTPCHSDALQNTNFNLLLFLCSHKFANHASFDLV